MLLPLQEAPIEIFKKIRLLASDIDGTMTIAGKIPVAVLEAFSALAAVGVEVLPVTGRPAGEALGLARYLPCVRRAIAENGASLVIPDQPLQLLRPLPSREEIMRRAARISAGMLPLQLAEDAFCRVGDLAFLREGREAEELGVLQARAAQEGCRLVWSSVHIHLTEAEPDKGLAVQQLAPSFGYLPEEIATIGDAPNDAGLWVSGRFGLTVGTAAVLSQQESLSALPMYVVGEGGDGWVALAAAICEAKRA